jgi:aminoglycoside phosphotransferase (APT) family kinase protein
VWRAFLEEDPDRPRHEAAVLRLLESTPVAAPRLVAMVVAGEATESPAVLMTRLPGATTPRPGEWLQGAATAAAEMHRVDGRSLGRRYRPYFLGALRVPAWGDRALWEEAVALAGSVVATDQSEEVFIHRDYHPGNLLWQGDRLGGIVDWLSACCGPPGVDVSHFGINLALDHDPAAVAAFRTAYERAAGRHHDRRRDVVGALDVLPFYAGSDDIDAWPASGLVHPGSARTRIEAFLASALAAC